MLYHNFIMVKPEGLKDLNINVINGIHMYNVRYLLNLLHVQYNTASQVIFKFQNTIHIEMQNANHRERKSFSTLDVQQICLGGDLACPVYGPLQY